MRLFSSPKKSPAPSEAFPASNPLLAVPLIPPSTESGIDNLGLIQLRRILQPSGKFSARISRLFNFTYSARLNLDERGTFFWQQIDGSKNLSQIADAFAQKFNCPLDVARPAILEFTRTLMLRNLLLLQVDAKSPA